MAGTAQTLTAYARQGDTLDLLVWRELGATEGLVEQALELNRGLADAGAILTEGQVVILPLVLTAPTPTTELVQLWS
ncbi:MAG: tail protein X [Asticcacaulis sp.]|uniref:tail protein X n=1 Tax=Asticcacaulis sp. TaxID=1872648 RepID=UPI003F7BF905